MNGQSKKIGQATEPLSKDAPRDQIVINRRDAVVVTVPNASASPTTVPSSFRVVRED
jgi:hypothetical protein